MVWGKVRIGLAAALALTAACVAGLMWRPGPDPTHVQPQLAAATTARPAQYPAWPSELPFQKPPQEMRWIDVEFPGSEALAASREKWTIVNLWATWCGPCVAELGDFDRLAAALDGDVGVFVVNVADRKLEGPSDVAAMFAKNGYGALKPLYAPPQAGKAILDEAGLGGQAVFPVTLIFAPGGKPYGFVNDTLPEWGRGRSGWGGAKMITYFKTLSTLPAPT